MEQRTLAGGTTEPDSSGYIMGEHSMKSWDGTEIFYRSWQRGLAKGQAVILFHGGHEHSGRFQDLIERLDLRQVSFFAWDARGHGRSAGKRGYARHFHDFIRDADGFIQHVSHRYKIPIENMAFLGHSVGSVIIATWLHDYARQIRGAILSSPAFQVKLYVPFALPLLRVWQRLQPDSFVSSYVKPGFLTHDKEEADSRRSDPLISPRISVRVLTSLFDTANRVINGAHSITAPVLCFSAGSDWVVQRKAQEIFFNRLGSQAKAFEVYPGFFHEVLHEKNRHLPILQAKQFIETVFSIAHENPPITPVFAWNEELYANLSRPLSWFNPEKYKYGIVKVALRSLGCLSEGIRKAWAAGFDAGQTLDYVYENKARGWSFVGRAIDRLYLNTPGWRLIRQRNTHLQTLLHTAINKIRQDGRSTHIVDLACGQGNYILKVLENIRDPQVTAVCRDIEAAELNKGNLTAQLRGIRNISFEKGDAFNAAMITALKPSPDIVIASGLYELYDDNQALQQSLSAIYQVLNEGGYFIYTNQPYHPQLELIARTLVNRNQQPWVMRLRSQMEINLLVRQAGFKINQLLMDDQGVFTVTIAEKKSDRQWLPPRLFHAQAVNSV